MDQNHSTVVLGRTVVSMRKARSRYDDSILWAEEANLLMLHVFDRILRIKQAGIGGSWEMMIKELREACDQMLVENPTLIAKIKALEPLILPDGEDDEAESTASSGKRTAAPVEKRTTYGLFFASVKALRDAFARNAQESPAAALKKLEGKAVGGMQAVVYKLWYMRHDVAYQGMLPNQRSREVGEDLAIKDDTRWQAIVTACVEAGYLDETQGQTLLETKPSAT